MSRLAAPPKKPARKPRKTPARRKAQPRAAGVAGPARAAPPERRSHADLDRAVSKRFQGKRTSGIRLLLVDDHRLLREALRAILEKAGDIELIAEADDGAAAHELARELAPDLVVMGIGLAGMSAIEATRRMLAANPGVRVLSLSNLGDERMVLQMLQTGACGHIAKSAGSEELLQGIRALAQGGTYLYAETAAAIVHDLRKQAPQGTRSAILGRREREVLQLLAGGKTSAQIAAALHIATGTAEVHRRNIMRKLDLHNVAELTKYAIREGLSSI